MSDPTLAAPPSTLPARVALVNPSRYLGNLLLAGGLMQDFLAHCRTQDSELLVVLDEAFLPLLDGALPGARVLGYPRSRLRRAGLPQRLLLWTRFLRALRAFGAELAFNVEDDSVSDRLTRWSGARCRVAGSQALAGRGYERVLPVDFASRPPGREHRWFAYQEVFSALGLPDTAPGYLRLALSDTNGELEALCRAQGLRGGAPWVALHAGATKDYKKWPPEHFAGLVRRLQRSGCQPLLIGAGDADRRANASIRRLLGQDGAQLADFTDRLALPELAQLLGRCAAMVGNDSGPLHLAAAQGVPGVVIFGPTEESLWRPLSPRMQVASGRSACGPDCSRRHCPLQRRCLSSIKAETVFRQLEGLLDAARSGGGR